MFLEIFFAFLAGVLTVGAPCILPLLPILLGASLGQKSKTRPLFIALGFVAMFSLAGLTLSYIVRSFEISPDALRNIAVGALAVFGFFMLVPKPFEILTQYLSGFSTRAQSLSQKAGSGNFGGFVLGLVLGLIWTPCAGPILGSILTLIATQSNLSSASVLLVAYAIGAGIPMLIISYGGQIVTTKIRVLVNYTNTLQKIFGALIILLAVAMYFQYDLKIQAKILEYYNFPSLEGKLLKSEKMETKFFEQKNQILDLDLKNYGPAPEFTGIEKWLNLKDDKQSLTLNELKGKVVLVDFWTYSCINCIRTLPYVTGWYEKYKSQGLVIVGVHTPEFEFEKVTKNVETAISRHNITYPVAQDNSFSTWNAYNNRYWPAHYLIDKQGNVRFYHFGEGKYEEMENAIKYLLGLPEPVSETLKTVTGQVQTPEIYFGLNRLEYLTKTQKPLAEPYKYVFSETLESGRFALEGNWKFNQESVKLVEASGKIKMKFFAGKIHMVAQSDQVTEIGVTVDGKYIGNINIGFSDLYTLFDSQDYKEHEIIIEFNKPGLEVFTFTFG